MNVIIRLQNLPWAANASDIRLFFKGLQIPEGGVHIIGGEDGDAFIAFSTDEDARQAMSLSGGKIKEVKVSLLLSSRAEMQKVIEKARSSASSMLSIGKQSSMQSAEAFTNQFGRKMHDANNFPVAMQPQALMANYLQQNNAAVINPMLNFQMKPNEILASLAQTAPPNLAVVTAAQMPMFYNNAINNSAEYLNYMKMANAAGSLQAENNKMVETFQQQQQSVASNPYGRYLRSPSRERQRSRSPLSRYDSDEKKERKKRTRFSTIDNSSQPVITSPPIVPPMIPNILNNANLLFQQQLQNQQQQQLLLNVNSMVSAKMPNQGIWDVPPPMQNAYANFSANNVAPNFGVNLNPVVAATRSYQANDMSLMPSIQQYQSNAVPASSFGGGSNSGVGACIKVANVDKETTYSDIRKFFVGFPIDDIKFLKDDKGIYSGVALIRFASSDSKKQALTKNGWQLKSTQIMITPITEEDYESGLDNLKSRSNSNKRTFDDPRRDRYTERYQRRDRSDSRERDYESRDRDRYNRNSSNNNNNNNRHDNRNNNSNNRFNNNRGHGSGNSHGYRQQNNNNGDNNQQDYRRENDDKNNRNFRRSVSEEKVQYVPDENFTILIVDDIPSRNEADLFEAFPNILSITIDKYTAYCKFKTHEAAKVVLENRFIHYIGNKRVFVESGSEMQFNDLVKKYGKHVNPELKDEIEDSEEPAARENLVEDQEQNSSSSTEDRDKSKTTAAVSRDPRQRSQTNGNDREQERDKSLPNLKTDCVLIKNLELKTKIEDVEDFFSDVNIQRANMRTHILLDKRGHPCGDCFVEFKFENDLQSALTKNNLMMGQKNLQIMPIPREQVEAVLSSFGGGGSGSASDDNGRNKNWAPPSDFGSPECVVMISNLCYRATTEDILDEFREFDLKPDQIIRRYNDAGQPSGNACVNFNSASDASKACNQYNKIKIMNRPVWLRRM